MESGTNNNTTTTDSSAELDRQTQARLEEIEQQVKEQPLTSDLKPLTELEALYKGQEDNSANFLAGVQALQKDYAQIRLVRGDGNCYYRAFLYALAEKIMKNDENNKEEGKRIVEWIKKTSWEKVLAAGYDEMTMEAFYETVVELMEKMIAVSDGTAGMTAAELHTEMNEENATSDYCSWYLRVVTAMHLKSDPDRFLPFIEQPGMDMQQFCQREVEPMGKECEMVQALALAEAMGVQVKIEYLDGHALVNGHYDILYPKEV